VPQLENKVLDVFDARRNHEDRKDFDDFFT